MQPFVLFQSNGKHLTCDNFFNAAKLLEILNILLTSLLHIVINTINLMRR